MPSDDDTDAAVERAKTTRQAFVSLQGVEEALAAGNIDTARARWENLGERLTELHEMETTDSDD